MRRPLPAALALLLGCAGSAPRPATVPAAAGPPAADVPPDTDDSVNIPLQRKKGLRQLFPWEPYGEAAFQRAKAEGRLLLLHGAAEWCHWCHVMEATTYRDPAVGAILRDRFVAIRVDIDARPDVAERYRDWGWPATVILSSDAEELGKVQGYLPPERMLEILREVASRKPGTGSSATPALALSGTAAERLLDVPPPAAALGWVGARVIADLDARFDEEEGGWGRPQKLPLGAPIEVELLRAAHGDSAARERALFTLRKQRPVLDPVWGGIYQYSTGGVWEHPHFEKLLPMQTAAMHAYARAYADSGDEQWRRDAEAIARYVEEFLSNKDGAFLVSQDADLGAHDPRERFVDGHIYFAKDDQGRRALGVPRVDDHVYGGENGLGIAAFVALYQATKEERYLRRARRAADLMLGTLVLPDGSVRREERAGAVRYLVDAAALGLGLARLAQVTGEGRYRQAAAKIGQAMLRDFGDARSGRLFGSTVDRGASGVFARRQQPFAHNVIAARFLCALARLAGDSAARRRAVEVLRGVATPRRLEAEGRLTGEFVLALDEAGLLAW